AVLQRGELLPAVADPPARVVASGQAQRTAVQLARAGQELALDVLARLLDVRARRPEGLREREGVAGSEAAQRRVAGRRRADVPSVEAVTPPLELAVVVVAVAAVEADTAADTGSRS